MMAIDPERAQTSMKAWARFIELSSARERYEPFSTLEEYLPYRIIDAGEMYVATNDAISWTNMYSGYGSGQ